MALFSRLFSARQDELHVPNHINEIGDEFAELMAARDDKPMIEIAFQPAKKLAPSKPRRLAPSTQKRKYRASSNASTKQLNVRVDDRLCGTLKAFAKHERITMGAVVETALRLYLDPH